MNIININIDLDLLEDCDDRYGAIKNYSDRILLLNLLHKFKNNKVKIAKYLNISRGTLTKRIKELDIK